MGFPESETAGYRVVSNQDITTLWVLSGLPVNLDLARIQKVCPVEAPSLGVNPVSQDLSCFSGANDSR
jgi:hypothetical protein